jgi:POT family
MSQLRPLEEAVSPTVPLRQQSCLFSPVRLLHSIYSGTTSDRKKLVFINVGALIGQITMSYAALYVGYYLAFLLPTVLFLLAPLVLIVFKKNYRLTPPQGSVLGPAVKLLLYATKGRWSINPARTVKNVSCSQSCGFSWY